LGGEVDTQRVLGTPNEVARNVLENIKIFALGGGFVFAAIHNIQTNVPPTKYCCDVQNHQKV
jgi:uroporphyrinogen-III decarboxylase